jgi:hypothetical protein
MSNHRPLARRGSFAIKTCLSLALVLATGAPIAGCAVPTEETGSSGDELNEKPLDPARSYEDRYKIVALLKAKHPTPAAFGDPRDGILAITQWQQTSGRAEVEKDATGVLTGWWPIINFHLPISQFIAMKNRGEFPDVKVIVPEGDIFKLSKEELNSATALYETIDRSHKKLAAPNLSQDDRDKIEKGLREALWFWHDTCVVAGQEKAKAAFARMPRAEQDFARAFADAFEPIMSELGAPPHGLKDIVPVYFPQHILKGDKMTSNLPKDLEQSTMLVGMKEIERIELDIPLLKHPLRNAARAIGNRKAPREIDPIFNKFISALTKGEGGIERLAEALH